MIYDFPVPTPPLVLLGRTDFVAFYNESAYYLQGKFEKALELLERCLSLRIKHFGEKNSFVADVYSKMAVVHWGCCRFDDAERDMAKVRVALLTFVLVYV